MTNSGARTAEIDVQLLWSKYEDIAMHFNDLLMRLRTQSLAGIAAVSTLVGLFSKEGIGSLKMDWLAATAIFIAMALFWVAIWCLDFLYYNRLLIGAVSAITELEAKTGKLPIDSIEMSSTIESEFRKPLSVKATFGVFFFYVIVLLTIVAGAVFSQVMYSYTSTTSAELPHSSPPHSSARA